MFDIYKFLVARGDEAEDARRLGFAAWFCDEIPAEEFVNDDRLFYEFINYCVTLGVPIKENYLHVWLDTELRKVLRETNAHVKGTETLDFTEPVSFETATQVTKHVLEDNMKVFLSEETKADDFIVELAAFFTTQRGQKLTEVLSKTYDMLNQTNNSEEAADFALNSINVVKEIYDESKLDELQNTKITDRTKMVFVTDSGIPALDNDSFGLYTGQLFDVEAQPGTGKTRFAIGTYGYNAVVKYKKNVLFNNLEQDVGEIEAMFVARHVFELFNVQVSDIMIARDKVPEEIKDKVAAARYDLFESGKYGKLKILNEDMYVETAETKLRTWDSLYGPFDLIIIDYVGLVESKPAMYHKELTEAEIIKTFLKKFKRFCRKTRKAGLSISQFNKEGVVAGNADKPITPDMAQGGMSVFRHTDYNMAISMTPTMRLQQKRKISNPKVRSSAGYEPFLVDTRLAFCFWRQTVQKAV